MHFSIARNTCFEFDGSLWHVDQYNEVNAGAPFVIACRKSDGLVQSIPQAQLSDWYFEKRLRFLHVGDSNRPVSSTITPNPDRVTSYEYREEELLEIDYRMGYVMAVSIDRKYVSNTDEREKNIALHALTLKEKYKDNPVYRDKPKPSDATVRRWFMRWRAGNYVAGAVLSRKGGNRNPRHPEIVEAFMADLIRSEYMTGQRISVTKLYESLRRKMKGNPELSGFKVPAKPTLYRRVREIPVYDKVSSREGWDRAQQLFPSGMPVRHVRYPFERVELDHTPVDIQVIDDNGQVVPRKIWATFLIDCFTRMIVGFYISFDAPSRKSVVAALKHSLKSKSYVKEIYPSIQSEYPCMGVCAQIVVDNGRELHSLEAKRVIAELNINFQYCPRKRPNFKGKIERFIRRFNYELIHSLPGTTFANYLAKGDYKGKPALTFEALVEVIHHWIIDDYHNESHDGLDGDTPLNVWNKNRHAFSAPVLFDSIDRLDQLMWTEFDATIQTNGIAKYNLKWNSKALQDIAKKYGRGTKVTVKLDEDNLHAVWVKVPGTDELIKATCTREEYARNLSLRVHQMVWKHLRAEHGDRKDFTEPTLLTARAGLDQSVADAVQRAKAARKGRGKVSVSSSAELIASKTPAEAPERPRKKASVVPPEVTFIVPDDLEVM